jgi:hypothetical protein
MSGRAKMILTLIAVLAIAATGIGAMSLAGARSNGVSPSVDAPGNCDEAEHATDPDCLGGTTPTATPTAEPTVEAEKTTEPDDNGTEVEDQNDANDDQGEDVNEDQNEINDDQGDVNDDHEDSSGPSDSSGPGSTDSGSHDGPDDGGGHD